VVFDCSGNKQAVLDAATKVVPEFKWPVVSKVNPVFSHHLLYYCHLDRQTDRMMEIFSMDEGEHHALAGADRLKMVQDLQKFGWFYGSFPTLYTYSFNNKGKNALYCAAPPNLSPEHYHDWVSTILRYKTGNKDCQVKFLPSKITQKDKLRRMHFPMNYDRLQVVGRKKDAQLPAIVTVGDAMIGFDYRMAHGVENGLVRIRQLIRYMEGYNGSLEFFDLEGYMHAVQTSLNRQEEELATRYNDDLTLCIQGHEAVVKEGTSLTSPAMFGNHFKQLCQQSSHALVCLRSVENFKQLSEDLRRNSWSIDIIDKKFNEQLQSIKNAMDNLSTTYQFALRTGQESTSRLLELLKDQANKLFKQGKIADAVHLYKPGARHSQSVGNYQMAYTCYSNAVIACKKLNDFDDLAEMAEFCLDKLPCDSKYPHRYKLLYNMMAAAKANPEHSKLVDTALKYKNDEAVKFMSIQDRLRFETFVSDIEAPQERLHTK